MNKNKKGVLNLKDLTSFKAEMRAIKATSHLGWLPDVQEKPEDRSDMLPEVRKAIKQGKPF